MKIRLLSLCVLFIMALQIAGCAATTPVPATQKPAPAVDDQTVILATGDWAPYTSETMENYGAFTEIVSAVFKEMGTPVKYVFYPWNRAEEEVKAGRAFAAFPYIQTEERLKEYDFSDPVFVSTGKLFYMPKKQQSEITYDKLQDLLSFRVGGVLGYWYEAPFKEAGLQTEYVSSDELNIQKLYLGRVDLAASEELVGWALIKKLYPQEVDQFATVDKPLNEDPLRLLVSRKYPASAELIQKFNAALKTINENGIMQQILIKYGLMK